MCTNQLEICQKSTGTIIWLYRSAHRGDNVCNSMISRQVMLYVTLVAIYTVHVFRSGEGKRAQKANCSPHGVGAGIVHTGDHSIGASVDGAQSCPFDIGLIGFRGCLLSSGQRGEPGGSSSWLGNRQKIQKV